MASASSPPQKSGQVDVLDSPLISGLPDDIALLCLARIPRRYHGILRCVSKKWKALLCSEEWRSCRQRHDLQETWIYALCRRNKRRNCYYVFDPNSDRRSWTCLQSVPPQCLKREGMAFETIGSKLYVLGGCSWGEDSTDEVYFYDASINTWAKGCPMPTPRYIDQKHLTDSKGFGTLTKGNTKMSLGGRVLPIPIFSEEGKRCYFVSAVLGDRLYTTDGAGMGSKTFQTWDTYDPCLDSWTSNQDRKLAADVQKLISLDGKIYSIHEPNHEFHYAGTFDPTDNDWEHSNSEIALCWRGPTVIVDEILYMLDETSGAKLMRWQEETGDWVSVGRLSPLLVKPPCQVVANGRTIIVIGKGLSTIAVDVDKAAKVGGMLVSSFSLPELDSDLSVLSCKTITI
ncbi:hypothetical protein Taro_040278 [Colocasia esculenta]|uniref:F-box domain-containing protein n=1 Tax=Colocasia esculenta TaxID=4460 RepID=A0A843WPV5_COLES|nr:hypothetical protein [Colocasia esculenta]